MATIARHFEDLYGRKPEVIAEAPGRVNLIGEHIDYSEGFVLPFAIDAVTKCAIAKRDDGKIRIISAQKKNEIIETLIPKILKTQFYKGLLDTNASEHGARMTAMDKASENANEMLRSLKISYNRARQAAITTELTEIVSGAAALQG